MPTPAATQIRAALFTVLETVSGRTWFDGRSDDEPVMPEERPAGVLRILEHAFDEGRGGGETEHTLAWEIDLYDAAATFGDMAEDQQLALSAINAAIKADDTLGGRAHRIWLTGATSSPDSVPDVGVMTITGQGIFFTADNDFNLLIGPGGQFT